MTELIALCLPGGPDFVRHMEAAWSAGHAVLPVDTRLSPEAQQRTIKLLGATQKVDATGIVKLAHSSTSDVLETGDALVVATSGSTGEPKGVVLTHEAVRASARITSAALGVSEGDKWIGCLPVAHIGGLSVITRALVMGTPYVTLPRFDAEQVMQEARHGATLVSLVPTALARVDAALFRKVLLGGAAPPAQLPQNTVVTYGMTETGSGVIYDHYPLHGVGVRCTAESELLVQSPTLLRCYTDGTFPVSGDGWFATGDAGSVASDGRVEVFGRIAEVINTGGEKVWPIAVERAIEQHPMVGAALVRGEDDGEWGQRVVAHVELLRPDCAPSTDELNELVRAAVAPYAVPKIIHFPKALARTPSGKVKRRQ